MTAHVTGQSDENAADLPPKAITLHGPYGTFIQLGVKRIETRSWATKYRGPLAIHQGLTYHAFNCGSHVPPVPTIWRSGSQTVVIPQEVDPELWKHGNPFNTVHLGAIVATCHLVDCVRMVSWATLDGPAVWAAHMIPMAGADAERMLLLRDAQGAAECAADGPLPPEIDATDQIPFGDFTAGRWAWLLEDIKPCEPIPMRGKQGLWSVPRTARNEHAPKI